MKTSYIWGNFTEAWADLLDSTALWQKAPAIPCFNQHCSLLSDNPDWFQWNLGTESTSITCPGPGMTVQTCIPYNRRTRPRPHTKIILGKKKWLCGQLFWIQDIFSWPNYLPNRATQKAWEPVELQLSVQEHSQKQYCQLSHSLHPAGCHSLQQCTVTSLDWTTMVALLFSGKEPWELQSTLKQLSTTPIWSIPFYITPPSFAALESLHKTE